MGCEISKLRNKAATLTESRKEKKLLFLGLDNAGKTSILLQMKDHEFNDTRVPTVGLNIETIQHQNYNFTLWDVGGSKQAARLWKHYFDSIDGVLFCVDISDEERLRLVKELLWRTNDPQL